MARTPASVSQASGIRRAVTYVPVARLPHTADEYPQNCSTFVGALHDVRYYQGILRNADNFSPVTRCEILESGYHRGCWRETLGEDAARDYFEFLTSARVFAFCTIENAPGTTFGCRLSLSANNTQALLKGLDVSPQFLGPLLGEPDYWAPGDFAVYDEKGALDRIDFYCQQPRWNIHKRDVPWCIYMTHQVASKSTTYLVVCSDKQPQIAVVKERLADLLDTSQSQSKTWADSSDPFLLHLIITHEAFSEAKSIITALRYRLYDQLDRVDTYSHEPSDRQDLEKLTIELHVVSQDTDSVYASADMAGMIVRKLADAHSRYRRSVVDPALVNATTKTEDALRYLGESIESQKRWLASYKSRKDIAMNLVYNLVTQQDSATSTTIARETKADSASMKVIAALTMTFLPATFLSSVFGMAILDGAPWWLFVVLVIPLTALVIGVWWAWSAFEFIGNKLHRWKPSFAQAGGSTDGGGTDSGSTNV
ncbi:hypothetical protein GGS23DRAFT_616406 [Durotheca rogersii]|uniref:uncharacterized protein n=1 Tax=Durotheca rogersii TaxID=419775 RepID=UPI00221F3643|nr:uncharacterized protein GGS23DRAFT_616406 [Durotheca rogersii]KAI5859307.1 hypothetical protein GGS23DRAFT_616406 [Durotheca rogersii]